MSLYSGSRWSLLAIAFCLAQTLNAQSSILNTNLIVNGNAEAGPTGTPNNVVTSIPGWTVTGKANVLTYAVPGQVLLTDPAPPDHGFQYFAGDPQNSSSTLTQTINVFSGASILSGGNIKFTASAYLGAQYAPLPQVVVAFQNSHGQDFSTTTLGPAGFNGIGLSLQQQIGLVPAGTAQITVTLTLSNIYATADSLSLVLSTLGPTPLGTNLVINGGAEAGPGAPPGTTTLYVPGWSTDNGTSVCIYGGTGWIQLSDPGPPDRGTNLFCGSPTASNSYQDIDVSGAATLIDSGQQSYEISAWLGAVVYSSSPTLSIPASSHMKSPRGSVRLSTAQVPLSRTFSLTGRVSS